MKKKKEEARLKRENQRASEGKARRLTSRSLKREASEIERELKEEQSLEEKEAKNLLQNAWNESAMDKLIDYKGEDAKKKGRLCYKYYELSRLAKYIAHDTQGFTNFITVVIIVAGVVVKPFFSLFSAMRMEMFVVPEIIFSRILGNIPRRSRNMRFRTDAPVATNMLKLMFFHTEHILLTVNTLIVHTRLADLAIRYGKSL